MKFPLDICPKRSIACVIICLYDKWLPQQSCSLVGKQKQEFGINCSTGLYHSEITKMLSLSLQEQISFIQQTLRPILVLTVVGAQSPFMKNNLYQRGRRAVKQQSVHSCCIETLQMVTSHTSHFTIHLLWQLLVTKINSNISNKSLNRISIQKS